jgi:cation:H+ antiporter
MVDALTLLGGAVLLYFGAEWLVGGASALALALRVPQLLVGLTVVAYGTSAPEVIVGIEAAVGGHGEVAIGNVIGSNVANVGLILGVTAVIRPARVDGALRRRELPVLVASSAMLPLLLLDGVLSRVESASLMAASFAYTAWLVRGARASSAISRQAEIEAHVAASVADAAGAPRVRRPWCAGLIAALGLVALVIGGHLFIAGAVASAHVLGLSERVVGLTIVALGTSLPELVTSMIAARRGHSELAVGNVIGSNIFNALLCLGVAGLAGRLAMPLESLRVELAALFCMTALAALFIRSEREIKRGEGAIALASFSVFVLVTLLR